jgi:hypothetical protein
MNDLPADLARAMHANRNFYWNGWLNREKLYLLKIFVDADACPVKPEVYRVARRYGLDVTLVANSWMRIPDERRIMLKVVKDGFDAADDWIVEHVQPIDIVNRSNDKSEFRLKLENSRPAIHCLRPRIHLQCSTSIEIRLPNFFKSTDNPLRKNPTSKHPGGGL